jgi:hypothetical protein
VNIMDNGIPTDEADAMAPTFRGLELHHSHARSSSFGGGRHKRQRLLSHLVC